VASKAPHCPSNVQSHLPNHISPRAALVAFAIAMVILAQGIRAPFVKDAEPQAASWIQDVASGDDILIPHDYYGELARKPPLFYWTAGAISAATGGHVNEVRARVVSVLAGAAVAVGVLIWTTEFLDLTTGWLAFLFLLGSYAFTSRGTLALEDMMLVAFMFAAWCLIYTTFEEGPSRRRTIEMGIVLGLGILTKGPVAIVLPAFGALIYLLMTRRSIIEQLRKGWPWMVFAISVAIALLWYLPAFISSGGELARIMFQENFGHFLPKGVGGTGEAARPIYYIAVKMIGGTTPLNFLLPALMVALIHGDFIPEKRKPLMFQLSFLLAMLIFFSIASAKRDDYVLPGIPSLAILFAALFTSLLKEAKVAERLRDIGAVAVTALAILCVATASMWVYVQHIKLIDEINPIDRAQADLLVKYYIGALSLALVAVGLAVIGCAILDVMGMRRKHPAEIAAGLGCLSLLGVLIFTASIRPEMARERTLKYAAADIARIAPDAPVYVINENEELAFYLGREAPLIRGPHPWRRPDQPAYLFAYRSDFRGAMASLYDRLKLIRQWDRVGRDGSPALYQLQ
jgi:4-amino-4-deoxy-L-arabinose transferase-like glycosyltransferase